MSESKRTARVARKTAETDITLTLNVDGAGSSEIGTGAGFLDHMLCLFAKHGGFDLTLRCEGDLSVDAHHTTEDAAICLGRAFDEALGDRKGITRYGSALIPMDEALIAAAADVSGRGLCVCALEIPAQKVGDFDTELAAEFFAAFARSCGVTLHIRQISGANSHHIIEGAFKAFARAMRQAVAKDGTDFVPSTKGTLL